ncbi:MAG TPA: hypothetical protein VMV44_07800 [Rectinemataceae bacterium]|nr:hypothetical protein [Rectinemataceae bacterium]
MTEATLRALSGLRDPSTIQWYVIPLLAIVFYIYATEVSRARTSGNWDAIVAGAAVFGADFLNETINSWIMALTGRAALWSTPGPSALKTLVGWNIEIMFMFAILGIIWQRSLSGKPGARLFGLPEGWFLAIAYSLVCVAVEVVLNAGGLLVWEWGFWNRSIAALVPIFLFGYLWFFAWAILAISRRSLRAKALVAALPYAAALLLDIVAEVAGLRY